MSEEDSTTIFQRELQEALRLAEQKAINEPVLRLSPRDAARVLQLLDEGVLTRSDLTDLDQRIRTIESSHPCKIDHVVNILDGKDLDSGGRTKGMRVEHDDLQGKVERHDDALCGYRLPDGTKVPGLKQWQDDVVERHEDEDTKRAKQEAHRVWLTRALVVALIGLFGRFAYDFATWILALQDAAK